MNQFCLFIKKEFQVIFKFHPAGCADGVDIVSIVTDHRDVPIFTQYF